RGDGTRAARAHHGGARGPRPRRRRRDRLRGVPAGVLSAADTGSPARSSATLVAIVPPDPPIDRTLDLPGHGRIHVRDLPGPPGAPAVLLLHGLGATARLNWGPSFRPLSQHFRVLSLDHRGHGRGLRTTRFRLEECADDAIAVVEALGVDRVVAIGYSMG